MQEHGPGRCICSTIRSIFSAASTYAHPKSPSTVIMNCLLRLDALALRAASKTSKQAAADQPKLFFILIFELSSSTDPDPQEGRAHGYHGSSVPRYSNTVHEEDDAFQGQTANRTATTSTIQEDRLLSRSQVAQVVEGSCPQKGNQKLSQPPLTAR